MFETQSINDAFKLPIEYNENKNKISESIQEDLELKDKENTVSLYNYVYEPKSNFQRERDDLRSG